MATAAAAGATSSSSAYMLDDDDAECPLCLDTLDISDLNFKPCSCGYQICSFCWHHIKENLNGRCPACRKPYDDAAIEFKPMKPDELKRLQAAKKQRDRERKDAGSLSKRHAANVRVKQRAQVHIQGMTTKMANEDTLAYLKGPEQFGKYGKILKLFFSRRAHPPPSSSSSALTPTTSSSSNIITSTSAPNYSPVNVYINYAHPSEATACINALDGSLTPDGHKLKAIWGTTRYCPAFLRGVKCTNDNCMQAHEAGEEVESNTHPGSSTVGSTARGEANLQAAARFSGTDRAEMRDLKHAWKEQPSSASASGSKEPAPALPATASWASRPAAAQSSASYSGSLINNPPLAPSTSSSSSSNHAHSSSISSRLPKAQNHPLPPRPPSRSATASSSSTTNDSSNTTKAASSMSKTGKTTLHAEPLRYDNIEYTDAWAEDIEYVKKPSSKIGSGLGAAAGLREPAGASSSSTTKSSASSSPGTIAPPTPPISDGSSSSSTSASTAAITGTTILPPGLPINLPQQQQIQHQQQPQRPLTPLSEFDRTLDTFGDGLSFAFNLSAMNDASTGSAAPSADLHSDSTAATANGGVGSSANSSNYTSRSGTPDQFINGGADSKDETPSAGQGDEEEQMRYAGHFDPFAALGGGDMMDSPIAISSSSAANNGAAGSASTTSASASPATRTIALPPGMMMSRVSTSEGSNASGPPPGLGGLAKAAPPPGLSAPAQQAADEAATPTANRHRSRFGFARQGSAEKPLNSSSSSSASLGSLAGMSIPVSELFKGINGIAHASSPSASSGLNGHQSPIRPASATSSNHGFALPPGVFASTASASLPPQNPAAAAFTPSSGSIPLPLASTATSASSAGAASLDLPLPPPDPSKAKAAPKQSLSDLFPGVNLEASFSASSSLPPALVKSLGISLENLDVSATSLTSGKKLPNFSPMTLGQGNSIGNQALPPPNSATSSNGGNASQPGSATTSQGPPHSANSSSSNAPPGLGSTRQAQQAHAQHAQQAHQAYLAAQQAQREQREREAQQQQQQAQQAQQAQQQHHMHGRPPSAASAGSAGKGAQHDMYGYMHSPPLPGTPGFTDASRFQDPAIVSFANLNGYGHHHPFAHHGPYQHHGPMPGHEQPNGQGNGEYYNRYHPLPTPIQPQQTYNPYIPVAPVGMGGMGRLQAQGLSQAGAFGLMRR